MTSDVVVVGAGPVGLTAALLVAERGASVCVVEAAEQPGDLPRAISIQDETFRTLDRLGLADALKAESYLDTGARYYGLADRLLAAAHPVASRLGHPAKSQFDQPDLERLLWDAAVADPRIDLRTGALAVGLAQDAGGVTVEVETAGGAELVRGAYLVAGDGGRSFVREALGVALLGSTQPERWLVVDLVNVHGERQPYAEFHGDGVRPYVLVPGVKGRLRIEFMCFEDEDAEVMTSPATVRELSLPIVPTLREEDVRRAVVYVAHQRVAETYRVGRVFLAGDAAHLMPPFAGQGLNAGMRDALNIGWKLGEVIRGVGTDRLLDTYETERRPHGAAMMRISRRIGAVVMTRGAARTRMRDAAFAALRVVPPVREYLVNMRFIAPPDYRDGAAVRPARDVDRRLAGMVGRSLPQPQVAVAGGEPGSAAGLDRWLGTGWALVALGAGPTPPEVDPSWAALGARRIRVASPGAPGWPGWTTLVDEAGVLATATDQATPHVLVVRPDRYVAAAFTARSERAVVDGLREFIDDRAPRRGKGSRP